MVQAYMPRRLFACLLLLMGFLFPAMTSAQIINITGNTNVCVGDVTPYTPDISYSAFNYTWTVTPSGTGTVLSGNSTGANIQWYTPGGSTINLVVTDPSNNNAVVYTGSLGVTVNALPAPYITSDVVLGCQPLNVDPKREKPAPPKFDDTHCQLVCANSTVLYEAHGDASSTYLWEAPGSIAISPVGSGATCYITWGAPGSGQVKVTETTAAGCKASSSFCVTIVERPSAKFIPVPDPGDPIPICLNGTLVLEDQSSGSTTSPIVSWLWVWGDGAETVTSPGAVGNPVTHEYTKAGNYTVTLVVKNACGCSDTFRRKVRVLKYPAPKITCPRVVCEGERYIYTIDKPCAPDSWKVTGGTVLSVDATQVTVVWDNVDPNTGFGYVSYTSCNPCPMVVTEEIPVILRRANIQGPLTICLGDQKVYRLPKWPSTDFQWVVSGPGYIQPTDQRNEIAVTATGTGTITLVCKYTNTVLGCSGDARLDIEVLPTVTVNGPASLCEGTSGGFDIGGVSGDWILYDPSNSIVATGSGPTFGYTFSSPGIYRLAVSGPTFCPPADFFITVVATPPPPDVILGPDRACAGIPVRYDAGNPAPGTSFAWFVSGGGVANAPVGDQSYITFASLPAVIQVVRATTDALHCHSAAISKFVDVPVPPLVVSGDDTVCHSTQHIYGLSFTSGDEYVWTISPSGLGSVVGNGNTPTPTILWNMPVGSGQTATITVQVRKCGTLSAPGTFNVFVRGMPTVTSIVVTPNPVCSNSPVTVTVNTSFPVNSATSYSWQWGDAPAVPVPGYPAGGVFGHTYNTDGAASPAVFTPVITIEQPNGCLGNITATAPVISVLPRPIALISPTGPIFHCGTGWSDVLTATETTGIGGSNTFAWSPSGTGNSITATAYGSYNVTVSNSLYGCSSTSKTVSIIESCGPGGGCGTPPVVTLSGSNNCGAISVTATVAPGVTGYDWIVPSELTVTGIPSSTLLTATATAAGVYTIRYNEYYAPSCVYTNTINVLVPYTADFRTQLSCNSGGGGYDVTLFDHSTQYPGTPISTRDYYRVPSTYLGTGLSAVAVQAPGTTQQYYEVINGAYGACTTAVVTITTPAFPTASISLNTPIGCVKDVVFEFVPTVTGSNPSYLWSFGDPSYNAALFNPTSKVYTTPSAPTYPVSLTVTDEYGCTVTSNTINVTAVANPYTGNITAAPNPVCQGSPSTLTYNATAGGPLNSYTWYLQDAPLFTTLNPTNFYSVYTAGGYWMLGEGNYGCKVRSNMQPVEVKQVPVVSISGNGLQCVAQTFTLTTQDYGGGYSYAWSGAASGSGTSLTQTIYSPGTYTYYVTITDMATGCQNTSPAFTVTVSTPPAPPSLSYNVLNCDPYELQLIASGAAGTYNWSNGMTGNVVTTPFGGPYQVTLTDLNGCIVKNTFTAPKSLSEYIWEFPTGCFCKIRGKEPYVLGPIIPLYYWAWLKNGSPASSGSGLMPNFTLSPGNIYNMALSDGICNIVSGDMYYDSDTCGRIKIAAKGLPETARIKADGSDDNAMLLMPNPASGQTSVSFRFAEGSSKRSIELYDITGRQLQSYQPEETEGSVVFQLDQYAAGMYQVVMRRDGQVVQQSRLSVTR
jgi:PKD repeat protein